AGLALDDTSIAQNGSNLRPLIWIRAGRPREDAGGSKADGGGTVNAAYQRAWNNRRGAEWIGY
ncbi:MAG: hypothetical protein VKM98_01625, partial [Cyanobacteriota bacterium]|nr:hypothetical protein [Cyanobacteriota bacterium]